MIVNLQSERIVQLKQFKNEIACFPLEAREDIFSLVTRFLNGERLSERDFKTFKLDRNTKIIEFKVRDANGNWRAVATIIQRKYLVFVYAFHKKSQKLQESDKKLIRKRIRGIKI